jgi:hypothetical protein
MGIQPILRKTMYYHLCHDGRITSTPEKIGDLSADEGGEYRIVNCESFESAAELRLYCHPGEVYQSAEKFAELDTVRQIYGVKFLVMHARVVLIQSEDIATALESLEKASWALNIIEPRNPD